ncbi:MAG: hypothetical protein ACOCUH_00965 [Bacteriovoracia bacterium]
MTDVESIRLAAMQYFYKNDEFPDTITSPDELFQFYLKWDNLQAENIDDGYVVNSIASTPDDYYNGISITMEFDNDDLAKAFMAQFTDIGDGDDSQAEAEYDPDDDNTKEVKVTYYFR